MKCMDFKECLDITQFTQQQNILLNPEYFSKIALTTILNWSRKLMHLNKKTNSHKLEASDRTAQNIKFSMKDFFIFCAVSRGVSRAAATSKMEAVNYYHKALHRGYCSSPRSACSVVWLS